MLTVYQFSEGNALEFYCFVNFPDCVNFLVFMTD